MQPDAIPPVRPAHSMLARRTLLAGLLATGGVAVSGRPAAAAAYPVVGRIRETYLAAGGASVLGAARQREVRTRINGDNTYAQRFARGIVWWGSGKGLVDVTADARVRLDTAENFRPVRGVAGVWRADDLDGCSALEERVVRDLGIATMIAMNSGSDPSITGVRRLNFHISNSGSHDEFYRGYVRRSGSRASVGRVLGAVAASTEPVLVHCRGGKDRTGWLSDVMQRVAGVSRARRDADYLATTSYTGAEVDLDWLNAARDQLADDYGTVERYLTRGCGMSSRTYSSLGERLAG